MGFKPRQWLVYFLLFVGVVLIGGFFWWRWAILPVNQESLLEKKEIFVIKKGESLDKIAFGLREKNLIKSPFAFRVWVLAQGLAKSIQAGDFRLTPVMSLEEIVNQLTHGTLDIWVTIPEGWRSEQIAEKLIKEGFDINFENSQLEGYLFPDTYLFPKDALQEKIIEIMKANFDKKVTSQLKKEASKKELTLHQIVTLASIVEREAKFSKDQPIISGILIKRWQNNWPLQADATVQYAVASSNLKSQISNLKDWWPKNLTKKDLAIDSPYNTYEHKGLPPGPICNPGLASIEAVVYSQETFYWFYLSDSQGQMHYAKTIEEHNANIARYLRK